MSHHSDLEDDDAAFHCITCLDEALPARVLRIDEETNLAVVSVEAGTREVDISLVDAVTPGDVLLVHGGVALSHVQGL